jgi:hypothetical protein
VEPAPRELLFEAEAGFFAAAFEAVVRGVVPLGLAALAIPLLTLLPLLSRSPDSAW